MLLTFGNLDPELDVLFSAAFATADEAFLFQLGVKNCLARTLRNTELTVFRRGCGITNGLRSELVPYWRQEKKSLERRGARPRKRGREQRKEVMIPSLGLAGNALPVSCRFKVNQMQNIFILDLRRIENRVEEALKFLQ